LAILDRKRYEDLTQRLHRLGFESDENEGGNTAFQRWKVLTSSGLKVTVDFPIPPGLDMWSHHRGSGRLKNLSIAKAVFYPYLYTYMDMSSFRTVIPERIQNQKEKVS
jgi:hypothetical protein